MNPRQFYLALFIFTISLKIQKMPALLADRLGKDGYLLLLFYFLLNIALIMLAFLVLKYVKKFEKNGNKHVVYKFFKILMLLCSAIYFMMQCLLLYESIQDLFSDVLFDNLSWALFSLLLIFALYFLASSGLKNIGRVIEVFFLVITVSLVIISIFGGTQTDFSSILPFESIDFKSVLDAYIPFNIWFGDFFFVLFFGNFCDGVKLKWTLLSYGLAMSFSILLFVEFYGIYGILSPAQSSLISVLSEHSMLGVDIGRIDWFFILFAEIGTVLSSALCLYIAENCISQIFPRLKKSWIYLFLLILLYFSDVYLFVDLNTKMRLFMGVGSMFSTIVKAFVFAFSIIVCLLSNAVNSKLKKQKPSGQKSSSSKIKTRGKAVQ